MERAIYRLKNKMGSFFFLILLLINISCEKKESETFPPVTEQTLLMYFPWSNDLLNFIKDNILAMENSIEQGILKQERVLVFMCESPTKATLFELVNKKGKCQRNILKEYTDIPFTTAKGISSILNDVQEFAPANRYAVTIGCHGMGWIIVEKSSSRAAAVKRHWEYENVPMTRYFGGLMPEYQTDITTLAEGIAGAGIKMEYIMFDDCYMSSVEVAYDLRHVTDYLIASTSEIMAYGMPYSLIGKYMVGEVNYKGICDGFYSFYSTYDVMPCGNIAVIKCSELDKRAQTMKEINYKYTFDRKLQNSIQRLDGYTPVLFYDYGDYVSKLCEDSALLERFDKQLNQTVAFKRCTEYIYSRGKGKIRVNTFSGIATSDPSTHELALRKTETNWYKATH